MPGFNQVIVVGNVGGDPETRYTQGGAAVASFSIATSRRVKDGDDWKEVTSWHRLKAFGKQAEVIAEHVRKGDKLFVEGRLDYWEAEGKRGKLMVAEVIVEHFEFMGGRREGGQSEGRSSAPSRSPSRAPARGATRGPTSRGGQQDRSEPGGGGFDPDFIDDDIPF